MVNRNCYIEVNRGKGCSLSANSFYISTLKFCTEKDKIWGPDER